MSTVTTAAPAPATQMPVDYRKNYQELEQRVLQVAGFRNIFEHVFGDMEDRYGKRPLTDSECESLSFIWGELSGSIGKLEKVYYDQYNAACDAELGGLVQP